MIKTVIYTFSFSASVAECFSIDHEYAPGFSMKLRPTLINRKDFYPHRGSADAVKIVLEDGERFMDKLLFEKLYRFSKNPAIKVFSEGDSEGEYPLPFTGKQFDDYLDFLTRKKTFEETKQWDYMARFLSYFKITHFLMPETDLLYATESIPMNFLGCLDVPLDLFPPQVIDEIVYKCHIPSFFENPEVVKTIHNHPRAVANLGWAWVQEILRLIKPTSLALGLDFGDLCDTMDNIFI